jgi:1L-myo-inositol 1-phosphate cytidylyltransferase / CDP-L-myo-inositol myo-inositolphosphotransferase
MRTGPSEGWILAGVLDGVDAAPALAENVAGLPYVLRLALDLAVAGAKRIIVLWQGPADPPALDAILADKRLTSRAQVTVASAPPTGDDADAVVVLRADRVYHRDMPKQAIAAWKSSTAPVAVIAGAEHDAVTVTDRAGARRLAEAALRPGGLADARARATDVATAEVPYKGFTTAAPDRRALRRAERRLVWSLRKSADGIAAKLLNRHISLPFTWLLMRTPVHPNHSTVVAFLCAVVGAVIIGQGGWAAGALGMFFVELGSIVDGIDGELARLKYLFSRVGQWMDTVSDDLANIAYVTGITINLTAAGTTWALPLGVVALTCFAITQSTQYYLITTVYKSGDLAAIPWAFQSSEFLSSRPTGLVATIKATIPKMLKRDFAVTMFFVFALIGHLEVILLIFSAGAIAFFLVFWVQFFRNLESVRAARAR